MQTLLLMVSLLLHLITFVIIRSQSEKMVQVKASEEKVRQQTNEMEEVLSTYLYEMKLENDRVINQLAQTEQDRSEQNLQTNEKQPETGGEENVTDQVSDMAEDGKLFIKENNPAELTDQPVYKPPLEQMEKDMVEQSASARACYLYDKGKSVEFIAKELNCGKTEVELMLKFSQNS